AEAAVAATRASLAQAETDQANAEKLLLDARGHLNVAIVNYNDAQSALYQATDSLNAAYTNLNIAINLHRQADMYIRQAQASAGEAKATLAEAQELVNLAQFSVLRKANADIASHDTGYVYDGRGQLITEQSALVSFGEHAEGGMKQYIGRLITEHDYDSLGNVTRTITAANTNNANTTQYYYDVQGNQTRSIGLGSSSVIYNSQNLAAVNINALKERRDRVYDDEGRLRYEVDELGFVTEHRYDGLNQKTTQLRYANAYTAGRPEGAPLTLAALDAFISEGLGGDYRALDYRYSARGELEATTTSSSVDSQTRTNGVHHNAFGDKTSTFTTYVDGQRESQTVTNQHHLYNVAGQLMASRDVEGYVTTYAYNGYGELSSQRELSARYVDSNEDPLAWDWTSLEAWAGTREGAAHERRTEFAYDHRGHRHQVTQVDVEYAQHGGSTVEQIRGDLVTTSYHDHAGRMFMTVQEAAPSDAQTHLTAADRTLHEYDALGRLVASWSKRKDYVVSGIALSVDNTDPTPLNKHQRTDYTYDAQGNLIATESDGRATYQRYDADGKLTKRIDAQGNVTHVDVDAMNRTKAEWRNVSAPGYQYEQRTEYNYDATGRQTGTTVTVNTGQNITESAVYNAFGEVTAKTHNGVVQENYAYDGLGRVHTKTMFGSQEDVVTTYQYNWQDKVTTETLGGSRTTTRQYDLT
ncbi:RHS repeat domain-containing protein, partial [Enterovibrio norvegicus]|uniref:RHS repeat domain-containing protein n=1 Tax=Enterovibrio norvegicus TaxID=188144 RepID=UPI000585C3BE